MLDLNLPEIKFAVESVREVMPLAEKIRRELAGQKITKSDRSPVTVADFSLQAVIGYRLSKSFPDDSLLGEESTELLLNEPGQESLKLVTQYVKTILPDATPEKVCAWIEGKKTTNFKKRFWTLDPIDGTKGFLRGAQYATALALMNHGKVQLGILGCPHLNILGSPDINGEGSVIAAAEGKGTWIASLRSSSDWKKLQVSSRKNSEDAFILGSVDPTHTDTDQLKNLMSFLKTKTEPRLMDSQAKYAALAAGYGDFFLYFLPPHKPQYRMKIWDVAPGAIVVSEAGGKVTDLKGNELDFSCGSSLQNNPGLLISNGVLHSTLLEGVRNSTC